MTSLALQPDTVHAKVRSLPALPQAVMELRAALKREDVAVDEGRRLPAPAEGRGP